MQLAENEKRIYLSVYLIMKNLQSEKIYKYLTKNNTLLYSSIYLIKSKSLMVKTSC